MTSTTDITNQPQQSALLSPIDVHLAIEVFQDARDKLCFLEEISPDLDQHKDELTLYVGQEIQRIIQQQYQLENDFKSAVQKRDQAVNDQNHTSKELQQMSDDVQQLAEKIRLSTKELCKNLKENPTVTENLVKTQQHRADLLSWVKEALNELNQKNSFYNLENEVQTRWMVYQEQKKLQQKEKEARQRVQQLQKQIDDEKQRHLDKMTAQQKSLAELQEQLQYQRERAENSISLFQKELEAAGDESQRDRLGELNIQKQKIDDMSAAAANEEQAQKVLFAAINEEYQKISNLAAKTQQNCDQQISLLQTQRAMLEQERDEKVKKIEVLEEEDRRNKAEKKAWDDEQAFQLRMHQATQKTHEMRAEVIRQFVIDKMVESLDPPIVKRKKGRKGKKGKK